MSQGDDAAAFFAAYDALGTRRAGSQADLDSARWLADTLGTAPAVPVRLHEVPFERFVPGKARLTATDSVPIDGLPLFDGGLTGDEPVSGLIGSLGSDARIGYAVMDPAAASLPDNAFAKARADSDHAAIIIALTTREGGLAPLNAHDLAKPFGPPVLQVAGRDAAQIASLMNRKCMVSVIVQGQREASFSFNLRAELPGQTPPVLLLTPRTSWWTSTAERAGGIWAWAQTLRALAASPARRRSFVGLATCGHELGHLGARHAFAVDPDLASEASLVIHLGANLGTAIEAGLTVRSNVAGLADHMAGLLAHEGYPAQSLRAVTGGKAGGEAHEIEQRGGRYLSLIGSNPWFHAPEDRWPSSIDLDRAQAIARGVTAFALSLK